MDSLPPDDRLIEIHEVLDLLEAEDEMNAHMIKLRFFAGMKIAEIAALLEVSKKTVNKRLGVAKLWLYRKLEEEK